MKRTIFVFFIIATIFSTAVSAQNFASERFKKGVAAAQNGNFQAALADFKMSLDFLGAENSDDEFRARIHYNIGVCLYRLKEHEKAVGEFERAIRLNPNHEKSFHSLGMAQMELKNFSAAERAFLAALRLNRRNGETWFDLAFVYLAREDYDSAQKAFLKAIAHKSSDAAIAHNNIGVILAAKGEIEAAVREFETALRKTGGKLSVARRNLRFCKALRENPAGGLLAKLEFGG